MLNFKARAFRKHHEWSLQTGGCFKRMIQLTKIDGNMNHWRTFIMGLFCLQHVWFERCLMTDPILWLVLRCLDTWVFNDMWKMEWRWPRFIQMKRRLGGTCEFNTMKNQQLAVNISEVHKSGMHQNDLSYFQMSDFCETNGCGQQHHFPRNIAIMPWFDALRHPPPLFTEAGRAKMEGFWEWGKTRVLPEIYHISIIHIRCAINTYRNQRTYKIH